MTTTMPPAVAVRLLARGVLAVLLAVATSAAPLSAQSTLEIGPLVGYYRPTGTFGRMGVYSTSLPSSPADLSGVAWGAEVRWWLGRRLGLEVQGTVTSSTVRPVDVPLVAGPVAVPIPEEPITPSRVRVSTAWALLLLNLGAERYRAWVDAGPGVVRHGGTAYGLYGSPTEAAGVVGLGGSVPLSAHLSATAAATATLYDFHVTMPAQPEAVYPMYLQEGFQTDVLLRFGLEWALR